MDSVSYCYYSCCLDKRLAKFVSIFAGISLQGALSLTSTVSNQLDNAVKTHALRRRAKWLCLLKGIVLAIACSATYCPF